VFTCTSRPEEASTAALTDEECTHSQVPPGSATAAAAAEADRTPKRKRSRRDGGLVDRCHYLSFLYLLAEKPT